VGAIDKNKKWDSFEFLLLTTNGVINDPVDGFVVGVDTRQSKPNHQQTTVLILDNAQYPASR
jgi:hypothetical protein